MCPINQIINRRLIKFCGFSPLLLFSDPYTLQTTISKNSHFIRQSLYSQVIKLLDKSKIFQTSQKKGGEHYKFGFI